ncbi:MAG TPA: RsmD family RNA methyltransferase [Acidimicrobiales bacterium]|nr:RsmD family RNA methyltransferase [Acidimicrobiales bacterium]
MIGGEARGRRLFVPDLPGLRPTSDFVREAMFDILESRDLVEGAGVLDLFSGSGALGIEALSRGAAEVTFVEQERRAVEAINRNLDTTGFAGMRGVRVVRAEALGWLETHSHQTADLALADPPYAFEEWARLFEHLTVVTVLVEHRVPLPPAAGGYAVSRAYRYGGTLVTLVQADQHTNAPINKDSA